LNIRNKTGHEYFTSEVRESAPPLDSETALESAAGKNGAVAIAQAKAASSQIVRAPMLANYLLCALAGVTWYMQFFFYTMGETQMGAYKFSSWTLHMASIIIFSTLWGIALHEWKGAGKHTVRLVVLSLVLLVGSTVVVGYGNYLGTLAVR
jgi:L-rhamnose-H+ transport protein